MIRGLKEAASELKIEIEEVDNSQLSTSIEQIPMMYRAQVSGRCSLQFAGNNSDLDRWKHEWIYPNSNNKNRPRYQYKEPSLGLNGNIYRIKIEFPFRLLSNCGQDSILRPVLGKNGIPFIPGSSIKGVFRRACDKNQSTFYCGNDEQLAPGVLRFHRAYPVGDWAGTREVSITQNQKTIVETRYRIVDVIHPQQKRQVEGTGSPTALASISFYQPTCIFELSSSSGNIDWKEVEEILLKSLQKGLGGKTSTGYGLGGHLPNELPSIPNYPLNISLKGSGVSPLLRSDEPEFRPNVFKATLRGHLKRLLGGACHDENIIKRVEDKFFGGSEAPGVINIFWEVLKETYSTKGFTPTFSTDGILHIDADPLDLLPIEQVLKFAFVMGGFGKSWRRVSHQKFYPSYKKLVQGLHIGCHWEITDPRWSGVSNYQTLTQLLNNIHSSVRQLTYSSNKDRYMTRWRESWHPQNVTVYALETDTSKAIGLFHDEIFKYTPAIGGRDIRDDRPTSFSSVWHRMLPIKDDRYLEIVTVFRKGNWSHRNEGDMRDRFIQELLDRGFKLVEWGR